MRFDSILLELSATPAYLLVVFCLLLFVFHLVFVWIWPISDLAWKRIDYVWLGAATLGLIGASWHADRYISEELAAKLEGPRTLSTYRDMRFIIEEAADPGGAVCTQRKRSNLSPPNYDEILREQQMQCEYFKFLASVTPRDVKEPFPALHDLGFIDYSGVANHEGWYIAQIRKSAKEYEFQRQLYIRRKKSAEVSDLEAAIIMLGPLLVATALALRITKVTGEVRNAKRKALPPP